MNATAKLFLILGTSLAGLAVVLGAFGAHLLKSRLDEYALGVFEVGVRYHFYHAFALILYALYLQVTSQTSCTTGILFIAGIAIFSGSLYALALTGIKVLGAITPIGGLCFILAWVLWAVRAAKL